MNDVWDIAQYVESHPDNYVQRWRLAKKLYMAWEYRLALEHLQVLKNEWDEKRNVRRYLAATYYRLSRHEEAIAELRGALEEWPGDVGLYEQLARTLDVAGAPGEALEAWKRIVEMDGDHPFAKRAVRHYNKELGLEGNGRQAPPPPQSEPKTERAGDQPEIACPHCQAMNSPEFQHCWQCHGALFDADEEPPDEDMVTRTDRAPWGTIWGATVSVLLAAGAYFTYWTYAAMSVAEPGFDLASTTGDFMVESLLTTRVIVGGALLVVWPLTLRVSSRFVRAEEIFDEDLYPIGAVLAVFAYALSWLPPQWLFLAVLLPVLASFVIFMVRFQLESRKVLVLWGVQLFVVGLVTVVLVVGRHGPGLLMETGAIRAHASALSGSSEPVISRSTPVEFEVTWGSTGSAWLDSHAATAGFVVETGDHSQRLFAELSDGKQTFAFKEFTANSIGFEYSPIEPGKTYTFRLTGEDGVVADIELKGILIPSVSARGR